MRRRVGHGQRSAAGQAIHQLYAEGFFQGIRHVIVTLGEQGALYVGEEGEFHVPGRKVVARDTTGAGDAFIGCFAHYWTQQGDMRAAMTRAVAYSACSVTALGTQSSYPDAARFAEFFEER